MYYPCSENKGADQLHSYFEDDMHLFSHWQKSGFLMMRLIGQKGDSFANFEDKITFFFNSFLKLEKKSFLKLAGEHGGVVVRHWTPNREVLGSIPTVNTMLSLRKTH